jgi:hypothetical protein
MGAFLYVLSYQNSRADQWEVFPSCPSQGSIVL